MKRNIIFAFICLSLIVCGSADGRKKRVIKAMGGATIGGYGLAIDASYDPKLDTFVPGYKMLNVAIINTSFDIIEMNPQKDQWWIKTKRGDKKYRLVGDLRSENAAVWNKLPDRARSLISYPLLLPIGARQVVDLFVPGDVPVEDFQELVVYINSLGTIFEIQARQ